MKNSDTTVRIVVIEIKIFVMLNRKSQSLNFWIALAVGSLAVGQITPATANPKPSPQPSQPETGVDQPIRSTTPNRTMQLMNNQSMDENTSPTNENTPPAGANPAARPTQSDGTNRTNPTDRRIYQNNQTMDGTDSTDQMNTPPAGANPDARPTQSDGTNRTNPTDRRIYQNNQTMDGTDSTDQMNTPPAGANPDMRPTREETNPTRPVDRMNQNNGTMTPKQSNSAPAVPMK
jgi:hypothetical protein